MAKRYSVVWHIDDSQPRSVHKAALGQSRALEAAHLRALEAAEAVAVASARASQGATAGGAANGHARAAQAAVSGARVAASSQAAASQAAVRAQAQATTAAVQGAEARARAAEREADRVERAQARQARGAEAVARRKAAAVGFVTQAPEGQGLKTVIADLDRLHASLSKDKGFYVAPGGAGAKPGAYQNVSTFLDKARKERTAVDQPRVGVSGGEAFVDDGRTRLARLRELGVRRFPVSVPEESAAEFERLFGDAGQGSLERQARAAQLRAERAARLAAMVPPRPPGAGVGAAAGGAEDKGPKIDVGLHKLQIDALKMTEARATAARRQAEKEAADYDRRAAAQQARDDRAADLKVARAQQAAEREAKAAQKKAADVSAVESKFAAKDYQARVAMEAKKEQQAERDALAAVKRAERQARQEESNALGPYGRVAKIKRAALSEEQLQQAANAKQADAIHNRRINQILRERGVGQDNFRQSIESALGLDAALTKAGIALAGVAAAKAGVLALAGAILEARKNAEGFGKTTADFMISLRPLASVMGGKPDFAFAQKVAKFGVETAMPKAEAATFLETFAGRAQIVKGKTISDVAGPKGEPSEYEKFTLMAGKMTTARGIPADIAGDLFASVLKIEDFKKKAQGAREAVTRAGSLFDILDAGAGRIKELAPQAQMLTAALASENELEGVFRNVAEVGVVTSLMAEYDPREAAVFARSGIKALSQFGDKKRQPFYKRAGIKPGMPAIERFQRANKVFEEEVAKGRPLEEVLQGFGLDTDVREKTALTTAFKARKTTLEPQLKRMRGFEAPGAAERVEKQIEDRFQDLDVQTSKARAENEAADLRKEALTANIYRERAEKQLKEEGYKTDPLKMLSLIPGKIVSLGQRTGLETAIEGRAIALAQKDAGITPSVSLGQAAYGDTNATINELIAIMKRNADATEKNNVLLGKQQQQKAAPQPLPPPQPLRGRADMPARH